MPETVFGIYGFEFTLPITVETVTLVPLLSGSESERLAADPDEFHLTGYGRINAAGSPGRDYWQLVQTIAAGMTFVQQQHVRTTKLVEISAGNSVDDMIRSKGIPPSFDLAMDRQGWGAVVMSDRYLPTSRSDILRLFVDRFKVEVKTDALRKAVFRNIEICRLANSLVELHHFLAFSALEILGRNHTGDTKGRVARCINQLLRHHGFDSKEADIQGWATARNKLFHEGLLVSTDKSGREIRLTDQLFALTQVLTDVILKELGSDDGHINWNRWKDRMAFV
jgi:hypothetical protein